MRFHSPEESCNSAETLRQWLNDIDFMRKLGSPLAQGGEVQMLRGSAAGRCSFHKSNPTIVHIEFIVSPIGITL